MSARRVVGKIVLLGGVSVLAGAAGGAAALGWLAGAAARAELEATRALARAVATVGQLNAD